MAQTGHGGARPSSGRKPNTDRKVKRSVTLSATAAARVCAAMRPDEPYSQTLDRRVGTVQHAPESHAAAPTPLEQVVAALGSTREPVAAIYRRLGWSRQVFEQVVQAQRSQLATAGVRLHVATKDAASGRREQYITIDGMRYRAMSRDRSIRATSAHVEPGE